jgi:hypothetical protein
MHCLEQVLKAARRGAFMLALLVTAVLAASPAAQASGPRPLFQMPFPCGQTWAASTYTDDPDTPEVDGHWPDEDSIDLGQWDDGENISEGEPVLASAAGTVSQLITLGEGAYTVLLDHGGGWGTYYVHIETLPPLSVGDKVAQGEQIGRTFNSGADAMHLHYTQMRDGNAVRIEFNGKAISTHAGNEASYNTWGSDDAEELTSLNCAGNSFMGFNQNGMRYQLLYKPGSGDAKIVRLDSDGTGVTTTYSDTWTKGWTHFTPFYLSGGQQHAFIYKSSSGLVKFLRLNSQGSGITTLATGTWGKGWTHFVPFSIGGNPYYLAYNSLYGYANIDRVNPEGSGATTVYQDTWIAGRTEIVPFTQGPNQYLLLYEGGSGAAKIVKITGSGNNIGVTTVWSDTWTTGWTSLVPLKHNGTVRFLAYKAASGKVKFLKAKANGQGVETLGETTWTKPWTAFSPLLIDGDAHILAYKAHTGTVKVLKLNAAGSGTSTIWTGSWTHGWA